MSYIVAYIDVNYFSSKNRKEILSRNQPKFGFSRLVAKVTSKGLRFQARKMTSDEIFAPYSSGSQNSTVSSIGSGIHTEDYM